ncbi:MAG TPA: alcohol dehydrogenase catalytic domain-containing protein [Bacteroidota bacterium]|nr:alcohol dehydrogenase catalytic domain-containing protein [Bacteroidota bacterium]
MKALVKTKPPESGRWPEGLSLVERPVPQLSSPTDVLVKVTAGGICGTDVGIYHSKDSLRTSMSRIGEGGVITGHEFCGTIAEAGPRAAAILAKKVIAKYSSDRKLEKFLGKKTPATLARGGGFPDFLMDEFTVTAEMHVTCGTCAQCKLGEYHVCTNTVIRGLHEDGAFASYIALPAENIVMVRKGEIPEEIVAFMDAIGNATHTVQSLSSVKGKSVAVLGAGVIGLMSVAIARGAGAKTIFVTDASHGRNTHEKLVKRRFRVARALGADECFDVSLSAGKEQFYRAAKSRNHGAGVDAVLEMSGSYHAYEDAFHVLRMGGEMSLLGLTAGTMPLDFSKNVIFPGVTIHGIIGRRVWSTWDMMTDLLRRGLARRFQEAGFVTHQFPLADYRKGFGAIDDGDALKVLLRPE